MQERADQTVGIVRSEDRQGENTGECINGVVDSSFGNRTGSENAGAESLGNGVCDGAGLESEGNVFIQLAGLKLTSVAAETNCKKPETYCPWNWTCPHLSTTSELVSIKALKHKYSTTTTGTHGPAGQNPYLARFLQPSTRIGDELKIDDAAAARMWRESVAVNPALTPREFVLIVRMKMQEWTRSSDARPGRKIRSVVGMLIRSMPNAVQGALYLAAHEQAPHELQRDCNEARAILAGGEASPRERAWALGILSES